MSLCSQLVSASFPQMAKNKKEKLKAIFPLAYGAIYPSTLFRYELLSVGCRDVCFFSNILELFLRCSCGAQAPIKA